MATKAMELVLDWRRNLRVIPFVLEFSGGLGELSTIWRKYSAITTKLTQSFQGNQVLHITHNLTRT